MTEYFAIRPDAEYTDFIDATLLAEFLNSIPELHFAGGSRWDSVSQHWFTLSLVVADTDGNFSSDGQLPRKINCVTIAASESDHDAIQPTLEQIASHIKWELVNDGPS